MPRSLWANHRQIHENGRPAPTERPQEPPVLHVACTWEPRPKRCLADSPPKWAFDTQNGPILQDNLSALALRPTAGCCLLEASTPKPAPVRSDSATGPHSSLLGVRLQFVGKRYYYYYYYIKSCRLLSLSASIVAHSSPSVRSKANASYITPWAQSSTQPPPPCGRPPPPPLGLTSLSTLLGMNTPIVQHLETADTMTC